MGLVSRGFLSGVGSGVMRMFEFVIVTVVMM
jgi:hypothetical protein